VLHAVCWKCRAQKIAKKSPSGHHRTTLSGYIFATKARIDSRKKLVKQQYFPTCPYNMVNYGLLAAEIVFVSLGHPSYFQRVSLSRFGSVTARHSSSGRQPNFAALNRGRHLYSAGRPSLWALAHMLVLNFTARRYASGSHCRPVSVCASVRPSQADDLLEQLNIITTQRTRAIAKGL